MSGASLTAIHAVSSKLPRVPRKALISAGE